MQSAPARSYTMAQRPPTVIRSPLDFCFFDPPPVGVCQSKLMVGPQGACSSEAWSVPRSKRHPLPVLQLGTITARKLSQPAPVASKNINTACLKPPPTYQSQNDAASFSFPVEGIYNELWRPTLVVAFPVSARGCLGPAESPHLLQWRQL